MPDRATELYEQFRSGKSTRILEAVASDEAESGYLDYKEVRADDGRGPLLDGVVTSKIKATLAEAAGAFANTGGGIIVWGVESKNNKDPRPKPFPNYERFERNLHDATGSALTPALGGIEHTSFPHPDDASVGFAVTYVPPSDHRPHMSVGKDQHRYYMRAGSNSVPMPHQIVRDMMVAGARPELVLEHDTVTARRGGFSMVPQGYSDPAGLPNKGDPDKFAVTVTLRVRNVGRAIAYDVACALESKKGQKHLGNEHTQDTDGVATEMMDEVRMPYRCKLYALRPGRVIYPGTTLEVGKVAMEFEDVHWFRDTFCSLHALRARYSLFARDFSASAELYVPGDRIEVPSGGR